MPVANNAPKQCHLGPALLDFRYLVKTTFERNQVQTCYSALNMVTLCHYSFLTLVQKSKLTQVKLSTYAENGPITFNLNRLFWRFSASIQKSKLVCCRWETATLQRGRLVGNVDNLLEHITLAARGCPILSKAAQGCPRLPKAAKGCQRLPNGCCDSQMYDRNAHWQKVMCLVSTISIFFILVRIWPLIPGS